MQSSHYEPLESRGAGVSDWTDDPIVASKLTISQHFLCNHVVCSITRGAQDCTNWGTPLEGCARLVDGDQPRVDEAITHNPGCAVHAICGPLVPGGVLACDVNSRGERVIETFDGHALACLDALDAEGAAWVRRVLQGRGVTVYEHTPAGGHYYFIYRVQDAPNGEELPAGQLRAAGSVVLHTRGAAVPLTGSTLPNGDLIGPLVYNWGFLRADPKLLEFLAARVQAQPVEAVRQDEAVFVPSTCTAPAQSPSTAAPPWELINLGARVFPLKPRTKGEQLLPSWAAGASAEPAQIEAWTARWPDCNWAVACGPCDKSDNPRQLLVIDCDGLDAYRWFCTRYPELAKTAAVETGRDGGGVHAYTWAPPDCAITIGAHIDLPTDAPPGLAIDVRGRGGYVVAPGSVHPSGRVYHWRAGSLDDAGRPRIVDAPPEWFDGRAVKQLLTGVQPAAVQAARQVVSAPVIDLARALDAGGGASFGARLDAVLPAVLEEAVHQIEQAVEGQRNETLSRAVYTLCRAHREQGAASLPEDAVQALLAAAAACGLPEREARACVLAAERAVFQRGKGAAFTLRERPRKRGGGHGIDWDKV